MQALSQPVTVPAESEIAQDAANLSLKKDLDKQWIALDDRYEALRKQKEDYNQNYGGKQFDTDSPEYAAGQKEFTRLADAIKTYNSDIAAFKADVDKLVLKSASASSGFDSRTLVTKNDYQDALKNETELKKRQQIYQNELAKLKNWQQGLQADTDVFTKIQNDAQIDCLHDVLMNIPASETFEKMADAKFLTSDQAGTLAAGYDALKAFVSSAEGVGAGNTPEQLEKILNAQKSFRDSLTEQAMMTLKESNPKAFEWYGNVGKTLDAAKEMIVFSQQQNNSAEAWGKFGVKLGTAVVPLANYIVIADTLGEKALTQHIVQSPIDSLNEAMSKNFDAQRYFDGKLKAVNDSLSGVQETISKWRAVHSQNEW